MKRWIKSVVGLDIGTSKVIAIVGEVGADGEVEIVGLDLIRRTDSSAVWWLISIQQFTRSNVLLKKRN